MITPTELNELERLEKAATPGPWKIGRSDYINIYEIGPVRAEGTEMAWIDISEDDAALIVAMRNALPKLIVRIREAEKEKEAAEAATNARIAQQEKEMAAFQELSKNVRELIAAIGIKL